MDFFVKKSQETMPRRSKSSSNIEAASESSQQSKRQSRRRPKIEDEEEEEDVESTVIDLDDSNDNEEEEEELSKPPAKRKRLSLRANTTTEVAVDAESPTSASSTKSTVSFSKPIASVAPVVAQPKKRGRKPKSATQTPAPKSENEDENYENEEEDDASTKILSFKTDQHWAKNHTPAAQGKRSQWKQLKQIVVAENYFSYNDPLMPTYVNIESPVSRFPAKKYCDMTGLQGKYTLPHPPYLRYHSHLVYKELLPLVKFPQDLIQLRVGNTNPNQTLLAAVVNNSLTSSTSNNTSSPVNVEE